MNINSKIQTFKLSVMFSIMFAGAFIAISAGFYYYNYLKQVDAQNATLKSQAESVLNFADVLLESRNEKFFDGKSPEIPQVIQNEVFDKFTSISEGKIFFKEARPKPFDPKNKATKYEENILNTFKANRDLKVIETRIKENGKDYYIMAKPIISEQKCIMCHPTWTPNNVVAIEDVKIELKDFYTALRENTILTILTGLVNIVIILILTHFLFSKYVSNRVNKVLEVLFRIENGNFVIDDVLKDEKLEQGSSKNEIDRLFRHLKKMVDSLKPVIFNVVTASKSMAFKSSYSYVKIDDTNAHVQAQDQFLYNSKEKLDHILDVNQDMTSSLNLMIEDTESSKDVVIKSKKDVDASLDRGSEAANSMDDTSQSISDLKELSNEVSKMTEIITDIADETNLISLNAAIEAARAGEHGRSFAVVADKIRELAEVSRENANEISGVLDKINSQIDVVSKNALDSKDSVLSLVDNSKKINISFEKVESTFNLISDALHRFQKDFENESVMLNEVDNNLNDVEKASKLLVQNANETKSIMEAISNQSAELKTLADGFDIVLNQRSTNRTVITPPIKAMDNYNHEAYIFDHSDCGISFYFYKDSDNVKIFKEKEIITLKLQQKIDNFSTVECEIVYKGDNLMNGIYFYGARIIQCTRD